MRKILTTLLAAGALLSAMTASQALTISITTVGSGDFPKDWVGGLIGAQVNTGAAGADYLDQLGASTNSVAPGSGFTIGNRQGWYPDFVGGNPLYIPPYGDHVAVVNAGADYTLKVHTDNDPIDKIVTIYGNLTADYGWHKGTNPGINDFPSGTGLYKANLGLGNVVVDGTPINAMLANAPGDTLNTYLYIPLVFGSDPVNLYVLYSKPMSPAYPLGWGLVAGQQLPPNYGNSIEGYVDSVPEPGSLAMFLGCGVMGSMFLVRRRRR